MKVLVTGATGLIGSQVSASLASQGHDLVFLSRDAARARARLGLPGQYHTWVNPDLDAPPLEALDALDGVIHLAGEPITHRWTQDEKRKIFRSRVEATRNL